MELDLNPTKPTSSVVYVDPVMARRWLEQNTNNRNISPGVVHGYQQDMVEGRWQFDGSPIRFGEDGRLLDGQHRLSALAGLDDSSRFPFLVVRGLQDSTQLVMDQGSKRSSSDQLGFYGYSHGSNLGAAIRLMLLVERGLLFRDNAAQKEVTVPLIVRWAQENDERVQLFYSYRSMLVKTPTGISAAGTAFWLCWAVDRTVAHEFFMGLATGAGLDARHPALTVRNYLMRAQMNRISLTQRQQLELLFRGFNAMRAGKPLSKIALKNYGAQSFPWPK